MTDSPRTDAAPEAAEKARRLPLYAQAKRLMLEKLKAKAWKPGEQIPVEPELARMLGVSVGTVRRAVSELVDEGILRRIQGSGTFVGSYGESGYWNRFQPFQTRDGRPLYLKERIPVSCAKIPADGRLAARLGLKEGDPVYHVMRLQWEKDFFVGTDELFLRCDFFPGFSLEFFKAKLDPHESLYAFYEREFSVEIIETSNFVSCEMNEGQFYKGLDVPSLIGVPICRMMRVSRTYGHVPVELRIMTCDFRKIQLSFDL